MVRVHDHISHQQLVGDRRGLGEEWIEQGRGVGAYPKLAIARHPIVPPCQPRFHDVARLIWLNRSLTDASDGASSGPGGIDALSAEAGGAER